MSSSPQNGCNKRRRTSESPYRRTQELAPQAATVRTQPYTTAVEGTSSLVGRSRELSREDEGSEPGTEETDEDEPLSPRRRLSAREGMFSMSLPGQGDEAEEEPETELSSSDSDDSGIRRPTSDSRNPSGLRPLTASSGNRSSAPRLSPAVLDLTDDGDDKDTSEDLQIQLSSTTRSLPKPEPTTSDEVLILPTTSSPSKRKRKSPSIPVTSPSPSTQPPPSAETGPSLPSLATLSCPICLGPPTPLALTACGHAFCAPCLHAALVAGPALTPPPPENNGRGRGGRGGARARARGRGRGARGRAAPTGRARGTWLPTWAQRDAGGADPEDDGAGAELEDISDGDPELNKHCPVCRTPLYGGWGKSLRGLVIRMAPVRRN